MEVLAVEDENGIPEKYNLSQNYPNPFNPTTLLRFSLPNSSFVKLKVYNLLGEEVKTLLNEYKAKGFHNITFDASGLPSGIYIYRLITGEYTSSKKMILEK
jgi:hypothetical protein